MEYNKSFFIVLFFGFMIYSQLFSYEGDGDSPTPRVDNPNRHKPSPTPSAPTPTPLPLPAAVPDSQKTTGLESAIMGKNDVIMPLNPVVPSTVWQNIVARPLRQDATLFFNYMVQDKYSINFAINAITLTNSGDTTYAMFPKAHNFTLVRVYAGARDYFWNRFFVGGGVSIGIAVNNDGSNNKIQGIPNFSLIPSEYIVYAETGVTLPLGDRVNFETKIRFYAKKSYSQTADMLLGDSIFNTDIIFVFTVPFR